MHFWVSGCKLRQPEGWQTAARHIKVAELQVKNRESMSCLTYCNAQLQLSYGMYGTTAWNLRERTNGRQTAANIPSVPMNRLDLQCLSYS